MAGSGFPSPLKRRQTPSGWSTTSCSDERRMFNGRQMSAVYKSLNPIPFLREKKLGLRDSCIYLRSAFDPLFPYERMWDTASDNPLWINNSTRLSYPNLAILTTYALVDGQWITFLPFLPWMLYIHIFFPQRCSSVGRASLKAAWRNSTDAA